MNIHPQNTLSSVFTRFPAKKIVELNTIKKKALRGLNFTNP